MSGGTGACRSAYHHEPVMCREVVEMLGAVPEGTVVDATIGGGGHAAALLEHLPNMRLVGLDRDPEALRAAGERLAGHRHRVTLRHGNFDALGAVLDDIGEAEISACLFDLGVSSAQLDRPGRGFSYRLDGPVDMRMDPATAVTAADIVNGSDEHALAAILRRNADERHARRIAAAIVAQRPFATTAELARVVAGAVPARRAGGPIPPGAPSRP